MGRRVPAQPELSLLDQARQAGVGLEATCGGKGVCGKCRVQVEGATPAPNAHELELLGQVPEHTRLACQCGLPQGGQVWVPEESRPQAQVILTTGHRLELELEPVVRAHRLNLPLATLEDPAAATTRLDRALPPEEPRAEGGGLRLPQAVLRQLPIALTQPKGRITAVLRDFGQVLDLAPGHEAPCLGLAVDLGTTTMVAYLVDLETGRVLAVEATMNPQVAFGDDVISRISLCRSAPDGLPRLTSGVRQSLARLARRACRQAGLGPERVMECVMVGNTAMHHIFLGLDPAGLALAPYAPLVGEAVDLPARDLELGLAPGAMVHWLPVKAGFVGADAVAVALAVEADRLEQSTLILDLGTNGEMILAAGGRLFCCSAAAGPAFEGGHVTWGMRGAPGAVESARVDPVTLEPRLRVIGEVPPRGICGSGLVSLTAQLVAAGVVGPGNALERFPDHPRLRAGGHGWEYLLVPARETAMEQDLVFSAQDASELQLAKAALLAGARCMMQEAGLERIEQVILAGAFGNYLDPADACALGLFPPVDPSRVRGVGNAAGAGALMALCSRRHRLRAAQLCQKMNYLELSGHPEFQYNFVESLEFPSPEECSGSASPQPRARARAWPGD